MRAVAVVDKNLAIGRDGSLLFRLPSDLKQLKELSLGGIVVMGRKTLESMPGGKPLPGRHNLVLSGSMQPGIELIENEGKRWVFGVFNDMDSLLDFLGYQGNQPYGGWLFRSKNINIFGGGEVYRQFLPLCDSIQLTEVDAEAEDPDTWFPDFRADGDWRLAHMGEPVLDGGLTYRINTYERIGDECTGCSESSCSGACSGCAGI